MDEIGWGTILLTLLLRFWPVWLALALTFVVSARYRRRLGLYGRLFDSTIGMIGFALVMFWVFTALFADLIVTHDVLSQIGQMKNKLPGTAVPDGSAWYLLGGDHRSEERRAGRECRNGCAPRE